MNGRFCDQRSSIKSNFTEKDSVERGLDTEYDIKLQS